MKDEEKQSHELFRGHLEECFQHFSERVVSIAPKGSHGSVEAKKPIAYFCGVTTGTVCRWLYGTGPLPTGEPRIKLMCYLDAMGYRVIELERMPKGRRNFVELIGFNLFSSSQAAELLGYSEASKLYRVLQGRQDASDDKNQRMWELWKERKEELERKKSEARASLQRVEPAMTKQSKSKPQQPSAAISIMEGLLGLLEKEPSEFSASELGNLPQSSASVILKLSGRLNILSSRLIAINQQKGGNEDGQR